MSKSTQKNQNTIKKRIMQAVCEIPTGKTISYSELAEKIGIKKQERYIATFLKNNPYLIAIPCHRVIKKNRDYGNYILGKSFKKFLLDREKSFL